ncbi:hypothetical protein DUI87_25999 [Hirundo rustica rustica]|uniref:Reverse transcriptase/retrotransposon-derived protein RNase H-like domain-containing protein n=1 Tax=Hirundo rustica rustica TaxID=333673 RepID=A0A3M0J9I4_HIRRU|nr:hypothetical protein DUI87_25999 [Hirundo rustica rustica]
MPEEDLRTGRPPAFGPLGTAGFTRPQDSLGPVTPRSTGIDQYTQNVKFLCDKLADPEPIKWTDNDEEKLKEFKNRLSTAPVLSLSDLRKEFDLFGTTEKGVAYGVVTQEWGGCRKPIADISKLLDPVARRWPTCIQAVAAAAILIEETQKLTLHGKIKVHTPHDLKTLLSQKDQQWLTDSRILKYKIALMNSDNLELTISRSLNPAQFLSGEPLSEIEHDCLELVDFQTKTREDLDDIPLPYGKKLFTDGSSRVIEGKRISGYAIVEAVEGRDLQITEKESYPLIGQHSVLRLIHPVIQGMQMTAMPIDPELAAKGKPDSLMVLKARPTHTQKKGPKEMLTEHKGTTLAQEMSTKFEKECKKLDEAWEILEKLESEMREHENLDYWEYRRNRDSVLIKKHVSI